MVYKRILLKLSGESLQSLTGDSISAERLQHYALEVKSAVDMGIQVAIVLGGGNIFRGNEKAAPAINRVTGDYMGMLATVINSLALQSTLDTLGLKAKVLSAFTIDPICERMSRRKAIEHLEKGHIVIISGGTGNPFFTTDTAAALRATEVKADILLKGTRVDGVYTADPEKDPTATKFGQLSYNEVIERKLRIMDLNAFVLCQENNIPILVFDLNVKGNLARAIRGEKIGTLITEANI